MYSHMKNGLTLLLHLVLLTLHGENSYSQISRTILESSKDYYQATHPMDKIILWVPNFSEGRNKKVIEEISHEASKIPGCLLLDTNAGFSTHRTIYTFAGTPEAVLEGALAASKLAHKLIDMTKQKGEHPRLGALDVSPFIPIKNVTIQECVEISKTFAQNLANELDVPVYLYGKSSDKDWRNKVPQIRAGEYEDLPEKLKDPIWAPDYGPAKFDPTWGASIVGCRDFLIAFNINLLGTKEQAHTIALNLRESGKGPQELGRLKNVQAIGWILEEDNMAQISTNILNYQETPIWKVYEEALKDAKELKVPIIGSEIIGIIPKQALLDCAEHYIKTEELLILDEGSKIKLAIDRLGLNTVKPFKYNQIIEYKLGDKIYKSGYKDMKILDFITLLGSRKAVPGGGSVSALVASLGASLSCMVGLLSYGNKKFAHNNTIVKQILPTLYDLQYTFLEYMDRDAESFKQVLDLGRKTFHNENEKLAEFEKACQKAASIPLELAGEIVKMWPHMVTLSQIFNHNVASDLQVSAQLLHSATIGCKYNVLINLKQCKDLNFIHKTETKIGEICKSSETYLTQITDLKV